MTTVFVAKKENVMKSKFTLFHQLELCLIGLSLLLLSSCAVVPLAEESADTDAKKFTAPSDKSRIYLFRDETFGAALTVPITLDSQLMGQTGPHIYFVWDVEPGRHIISCLGQEIRTVEIFPKKGGTVFIKQEMLMGTAGTHCSVYEVSEDQGKVGVLDGKLGKQVKH